MNINFESLESHINQVQEVYYKHQKIKLMEF